MASIHFYRQKAPLGLGHAILQGKVFAAGEPVAVLLPDEIMDSDPPCLAQMIKQYEQNGCSVLGIREVPDAEVHRYGIVDGKPFQGDSTWEVSNLVEKPKRDVAPSNLAIIGRYVITPEIFDILEETKPGAGGEIQLTDALNVLAHKERMLAQVYEGNRYDCGDKFGFLQATISLALKRPDLGPELANFLRELEL